jgi:hypothetical protein
MDQILMLKPSAWNPTPKNKQGHQMSTWYVLSNGSQSNDLTSLMQDSELDAQLERIEIGVHKFSLMVEALGEAEGIDVSSIASDTQDGTSNMSLPQITSDMPMELKNGDHD